MELRRRKLDEVVLTLMNDYDNRYDEISIFKGLLDKLRKDTKRTGFIKKYTKQETELINYLHDSLDEKPKD